MRTARQCLHLVVNICFGQRVESYGCHEVEAHGGQESHKLECFIIMGRCIVVYESHLNV